MHAQADRLSPALGPAYRLASRGAACQQELGSAREGLACRSRPISPASPLLCRGLICSDSFHPNSRLITTKPTSTQSFPWKVRPTFLDQLLDSPRDTPSVLQLQPAQTALILTPPDPLPSSSPPGANGCQPLVTSGKPDSSLSLPISSHALSPPGPQAPGCLSSISTASPDSPASLPRSQELLLLPIPFAPAAILGSTDLTRELPYLKICYGVLLLQNEGHSQATQALLSVATSRPAPLAGMPVRVSHVPCVQAPCSLPSGDRLHFLPPGLCSCQNDTSAET